MNPASEVISQSKRVSDTSCAVTGEGILTSAITNEINANEPESAGNESSETIGINKTVTRSESLFEQNSITKGENNQRTAELQQEKIPKEENLEHNENNTSTELNISNEINLAETENDNIDHDEERQKNVGCCGCFVEVCYCVSWYWQIMIGSVVSCFRSCGNSLRSLCRSCGNRNIADDDGGNYFYSDLNAFNTDIIENDDDGIIVVDEAATVLTNNPSVPDGNGGGNDNCAVDEGSFANSKVDGGGCDNYGADRGGDTGDAQKVNIE